MVYLDYSATTPVNSEVIDSFVKVCNKYPANPNSLHKLGVDAKNLIDASTKQIAAILGVKPNEVIYTSGSSEANNTAIKGICLKYQNRGKHILTTRFEHSSVYGPISYLQSLGFEMDFIDVDENGLVSIDSLKEKIREDTVLVTIASVNSEIGLMQPVLEVGKFLKENYPKCFFHVDMTQSVGKYHLSLENIDLASFSGHKIYGMKGIGALIKKENIEILPLIHGGKSTTVYRSGTPTTPLIVSLAKALRLITSDMKKNYLFVGELNRVVREKLSSYENVFINSNDVSLPYILNISVVGVKPETFLHALEEDDIYISTQTACSSSSTSSLAVYTLTKDEKRASSSLRISLSYLTTMRELEEFFKSFDKNYKKLTRIGE